MIKELNGDVPSVIAGGLYGAGNPTADLFFLGWLLVRTHSFKTNIANNRRSGDDTPYMNHNLANFVHILKQTGFSVFEAMGATMAFESLLSCIL